MLSILDVRIIKPRVLRKIDKKYWVLEQKWYFDIVTNRFTIMVRNQPGWITDKRSGSDAINWLVPKDGNDIYDAFIGFHDTAWSGWLGRYFSNNILCLGMVFSKEVYKPVAYLARKTLDRFGKYYSFHEELPIPYTNNRSFEQLTVVAAESPAHYYTED